MYKDKFGLSCISDAWQSFSDALKLPIFLQNEVRGALEYKVLFMHFTVGKRSPRVTYGPPNLPPNFPHQKVENNPYSVIIYPYVCQQCFSAD